MLLERCILMHRHGNEAFEDEETDEVETERPFFLVIGRRDRARSLINDNGWSLFLSLFLSTYTDDVYVCGKLQGRRNAIAF